MSFVRRLFLGFGWFCRHEDTFREYRGPQKTPVLHLVCHDCGRAVPAIRRTRKQVKTMRARFGPGVVVRAKRKPAEVVEMRRSTR